MELDIMRVRYYGITDECLECQHCGRTDLKKTIMLHILDEDGNLGELTYFGTTCAARALGTTAADVRKKAQSAQTYRTTRVKELEKLLDSRWCTQWISQKWDTSIRRDGGIRLNGAWYAPGIAGHDRAEYIVAQELSYRKELAYCL